MLGGRYVGLCVKDTTEKQCQLIKGELNLEYAKQCIINDLAMGERKPILKKMTAHWIVLPHEACCSQCGGPLGPMKVKLWWP